MDGALPRLVELAEAESGWIFFYDSERAWEKTRKTPDRLSNGITALQSYVPLSGNRVVIVLLSAAPTSSD